MVDIEEKLVTRRTAVAKGRVLVGPKICNLIKQNQLKKGDVLTVAQIAAIIGAKKTSELIPLCHQIPLSKVDVDLVVKEKTFEIEIKSTVKTLAKTGVEMEALTAVSIAALTIYDMCKSVSKDIVIKEIRLCFKTGGKSDFVASTDKNS